MNNILQACFPKFRFSFAAYPLCLSLLGGVKGQTAVLGSPCSFNSKFEGVVCEVKGGASLFELDNAALSAL